LNGKLICIGDTGAAGSTALDVWSGTFPGLRGLKGLRKIIREPLCFCGVESKKGVVNVALLVLSSALLLRPLLAGGMSALSYIMALAPGEDSQVMHVLLCRDGGNESGA